jgi:hypothetical protein
MMTMLFWMYAVTRCHQLINSSVIYTTCTMIYRIL